MVGGLHPDVEREVWKRCDEAFAVHEQIGAMVVEERVTPHVDVATRNHVCQPHCEPQRGDQRHPQHETQVW